MFSLTQGGNLTALAGLLATISAQVFGFDILPGQIESVIIAIGIIVSWVGRWRKGDLTLAGFRKAPALE